MSEQLQPITPDVVRMVPIGVRHVDQPYSPTLTARVKTAFKALTQKFPQTGSGRFVRIFSSWSAWDTALNSAQPTSDPGASSLIFAGTRWLGNRLPEPPIRVVETSEENDDTTPVPNHQLSLLMKRPNGYYSAARLWKAFASSWILDGNAYFIKWRTQNFGKAFSRNGDALRRVSELWYEPHMNVRPRWMNDGQGEYLAGPNDKPNQFINYYEVMRNGKANRVEVEDVIHFADGSDPANSRLGMSGVKLILKEILTDAQIATFGAKLLGNGGVPPYVLSIDNSLSLLDADDLKAIKDQLRQQTQTQAIGEPLVISGAKAEKLGWSPAELDLRVSRYMGEERFAAVTGIPAIVMELGVGGENSTYNNVSEAEKRAAEGYLVPLWKYISEELTIQLLPEFDDDPNHTAEHRLSRVRALQENENEKAKRLISLFTSTVIMRNEVRSSMGWGPSDPEDKEAVKDRVFYQPRGVALLMPGQVPEEALNPDKTLLDGDDEETDDKDKNKLIPPAKKPNGNSKVVTK